MTYTQAINGLKTMLATGKRWIKIGNKIATVRDCKRIIDHNNDISPESWIEKERRTA